LGWVGGGDCDGFSSEVSVSGCTQSIGIIGETFVCGFAEFTGFGGAEPGGLLGVTEHREIADCAKGFLIFAELGVSLSGEFVQERISRCGERAFPFIGSSHLSVSEEESVDLVCAFVDAADAGIAVNAGDGEFFGETVTAINLQAVVDDFCLEFCGHDFAGTAFDGVFLGSESILVEGAVGLSEGSVDVCSGSVEHGFYRKIVGGHIGEF